MNLIEQQQHHFVAPIEHKNNVQLNELFVLFPKRINEELSEYREIKVLWLSHLTINLIIKMESTKKVKQKLKTRKVKLLYLG